jgi:hypothetical protein
MGQWLGARCRSSEPSIPICPALDNPRRACHRQGAGRHRDTAPTLSRSHNVAKSNTNRFNRKISIRARVGRPEKVSQILNQTRSLRQYALGSIPAVPKHQTKTAATYLHHTNDHLYLANSAPPSPLTHPTEQHSLAPRTSHNLIEKQYHTRLNGLYAALLSTKDEW